MNSKDDLPRALITDIQRFSVHDGPGIRTIVFFKGCPLRCRWCQNPETQLFSPEIGSYPEECIGCGACVKACPTGARKFSNDNAIICDQTLCDGCGRCAEACYPGALKLYGHWYTLSQLLERVLADGVFYRHTGGGVTLSGGEPTAQPVFVQAFLEALKQRGVHTAMETCGYCSSDIFAAMLPYIDLLLYDVKVVDSDRHLLHTGKENHLILENLARAGADGNRIIIRVPYISGVNNDGANLDELVILAKQVHAAAIHLLPFHHLGESKWDALRREYPCRGQATLDHAEVEAAANRLRRAGIPVDIGGANLY